MKMFIAGFGAGFATLFVLILIFGDYDDMPVVAQAETQIVAQALPTGAPTATTTPAGLTFEDVCDVSRRNLTQPQMQAHARSFEGQTFEGWQLYVYDVQVRQNGYRLLLSSDNQDEAILWTRDIEIEDIPELLAMRLNVNQPVTLSGRIEAVETGFGVMCNPLRVADWELVESDTLR